MPAGRHQAASSEAIHLVVDSTGLKVFGAGEWLENKHKTKAKRKSWRKRHLGLDLVSGEIICSDLTTDDVGDPTAFSGLLEQIYGSVTRFIVDGAYDGAPSRDLLDARFGANLGVIIPPPKTAVLSPKRGAIHWFEIAILHRSKPVADWPGKKRGILTARKIEAKIGVRVLNRMTELGRPQLQRVTLNKPWVGLFRP